MTSTLSRLYASGGPEWIYETVTIDDGATVHRFVNGWDDLAAKDEDGVTQSYTAAGIEIDLPPKNEDGAQDITIRLSNLSGDVSQYIRSAIAGRRSILITRRIYTSDDLTAPAEVPQSFTVKSGSFDSLTAEIRAGYYDVLNTAWPRLYYDLTTFPGLRYIQ